MDIELFKTFLEVRSTRHFGRAAENLYLTQAAVSARIKQMEEHFGVQLFLRKRNNLQLTAEGERLVPHAETMLLAWSRARQDVGLQTDQTGQLGLGAVSDLWNHVFKYKLYTLYQTFPEVALRCEVHSPEHLIRLVTERALDIGIIFDAPGVPDMTVKLAGKLKLVLASTIPGISPRAAIKENYIYVDWGTAFNMFHAKRFTDAAPAILYTSLASNAEAFMAECPASAFLPLAMVEASAIPGMHVVDGAPSFSRDVSIIYRSNNERSAVIEQVIRHLKV